MLSEKAVNDFREIYKREFGEELPVSEAQERATKLLMLFKVIYRPIKKEWVQELKSYDQDRRDLC